MAKLPYISPELIQNYQAEIAKSATPATLKRKSASLKNFFNWATENGHISQSPFAKLPITNYQLPIQEPKTGGSKPKILTFSNFLKMGILGVMIILIFLLAQKLKIPIPFIKTPASTQEIAGQPTAGQQAAQTPSSQVVQPTILSPWKLYTKLTLTDSSGNPAVGSQTVTFKIYKNQDDPTSLWTSEPITVTTDTNGNSLISLDNVPTDIFFQNEKIYLEANLNGSPSGSRIPISTANVAANLGGFFPASPTGGAGPLTIPVLSEDGSLLLASESPAIKAKNGNLLVEGQALLISTPTGSDGNITVNPDGYGITQFLFDGSGKNFLNVQAPNLTSGSLFYGLVANNSTGYDLLRLQSGSSKTTRFSVDALGNTNLGGALSTSSIQRLTSAGALTNITGYSQTSGNFSIIQAAGDTATINKNSTALSDVLNLLLDERSQANSDYSTLVLKRYNGSSNAYALLVDEGNARFDGQLQLGQFASTPSPIGQGSLIFNTSDSNAYLWTGSSWVALAGSSAAGFWQRNLGVLSPLNITDDLTIGGIATSSAKFQIFGDTGIARGPIQDKGGEVYNVKAYGAVGDGTTDDTTAVQATINAADATNGGIIYFPSGTYLISSALSIPNDGRVSPFPRQKSFRFTGTGSSSDFGNAAQGGAILDLRDATGIAKFDTRGNGYLEIDHLTLQDNGSDAVPFIQTTNTTLNIHDNYFYGTKSGTSADQDAIILGGTSTTVGGGSDAPFQGYGTTIENNTFNQIRRGVYLRTYANGVVIKGNSWTGNCGSNLADGAALESDGDTSDNHGNYIVSNIFEVNSYPYGIKMADSTVNNIEGNGFYDPTATTLAYIRFESTASRNFVIEGIGAYGYTMFSDANGTNNRLTSNAYQTNYLSQNLAIGTGTPTEMVTINGGASASTLGLHGDTNTNANIYMTEGGNIVGAMLQYDGAYNMFKIHTASGSWADPATTIKLVIDRVTGNVGIGTGYQFTPPQSRFEVTGTATGKALVRFDEKGDQDVFTASVSAIPRFRITNSGDVIIGPSGTFDHPSASEDAYVLGNLEVDGTIYGTLSGIINPGFTQGSVVFQGASGLAEDNTNFFWDNSNKRLGIGDNTPQAALTVGSGDLFQVAGTSGDITTAGDINVNGGDIKSTGALTVTPGAGTNLNVTLSGTGDFAVNTDDLYVDTSEGRVGIGTNTPAANLNVFQNAPSANQILFQIGTSDYANRFSIDEDGDVMLGVNGASTGTLSVYSTTSGQSSTLTSNQLIFYKGATSYISNSGGTSGALTFRTQDSSLTDIQRLTITAGDSSPNINITNATLNLGNNIITNIGNAGTDFDTSGGLTLADDLAVNGGNITSTGTLAINSATTNAVSLDSGTTGAVNIGTGANSKTITVGNNSTNTTVVLTKGASGYITFTGYDCTSPGYTNNGKLTADASGHIVCADDIGGGGATNVPWSGLTSPSANLTLDHTASGQYTTTMNWTATGALSPWTMNLINNDAGAASQNFVTINNAVSTQAGNTEALLVLNNADTDVAGSTIVDNAILITNSGGLSPSITDAIDASATGITNALNIGANKILGTTGVIDFTNFDVASTGNITVQPAYGIDTNAAGELKLGDATATTVSIGTTAASIINIGATGALTRTINIGTGTGADTIHIGDGATGADVITIGSANAGNVSIRSNAILNLTGSINSIIDFPNFDVATSGDITTAGDIAVNGGDITSTGALTVTPAANTNLNVVLSGTGDFVVNTSDLYVDTSLHRVGIGDTTPAYMFVVGNGDLFQVDSSGNAKAPTVAIGTGTIARTDRILDVNQSTPLGTTPNSFTSTIQRTLTGTAGADISTYNSYNSMTINGTDATFAHNSTNLYADISLSNGNTVDTMYGGLFYSTNNSNTTSPDGYNYTATTSAAIRGNAINSGTGKIGSQYGAYFTSYLNSAGTITTAYGENATAYNNNASGTLTNAYGNNATVYTNSNGASITSAYGTASSVYEFATQSSGGITTGYGGYFAAEDAATTYGLYAVGRQNTDNTETFTNVYGMYSDCIAGDATHGTNITITNCYALKGVITENKGAIQNAYGGHFSSTSTFDTGYGVYSTLTGASTTSYGVYSLLSGAATQYGLSSSVTSAAAGTAYALYADAGTGAGTEYAGIFLNGNVGISDTNPTSLLTVGNGDLFQIDSSGRIVSIDGVAHTIDDVSGDLTLTSNSTSVVVNDNLAVNGGNITSTGALTITPAANTNLNVTLSGTGDFAVNTNQLYVDTSAASVGIGNSSPNHTLDVTGNIGLSASGYINWGATDGSGGYGLRDNSGTIEYKASGGSWAAIGSGGGTTYWTLNATDGTLYPVNETLDILIGATATSSAEFAFKNLAGGTPIFATTGVIQAGSGAGTTYSRFGTGTTGHGLSTADDLLVSGKLEVDGTLFLDSSTTIANSAGTATVLFSATPITTPNTLSASNWLIENTANVGMAALMVNQTKDGDIFTASSSAGTTRFTVNNAGNVSINGSGVMLTVGGGSGKVDMGTVDPVYNINGEKYATYMSAMTGVKEETTGNVTTYEYLPGIGYRNLIDFKTQTTGSDLWLFGKATDVRNNIDKMVVLLSPADNTKTWYEIDKNNYTLAIYSSKPTTISYRLTAPRFDYAQWSNYNDNPNSSGFVINDGDLNANGEGKIPKALNLADFEIIKDGMYKIYQNISEGSKIAVDEFGSFANLVAGNIRAGAIETSDFTTQNLYTFQGTIDNLLVKSGLVSPNIQTALISPLPDGKNIAVQIGNNDQTDESGKLTIQNNQGEEVASIDETGNVYTQGNLTALSATFSGTLYANKIQSTTLDEIQNLLHQVEQDQDLLSQAATWNSNTATPSGQLDNLTARQLFVTDSAAINSLSITKTIAIGTDLVFGSSSQMANGNWQMENTLNSLSAPLQIQSLALAPVEIMAGKVKIATNGDVEIDANLNVTGKIEAKELVLGGFGDLLTLKDATGSAVTILNASGSAQFKEVTTDKLIIAAADTSTVNQSNSSAVINTNATVGKAVIPAGTADITINNSSVSDNTLIYLTATSSTLNNVLYIKSKEAGKFVVGFTEPVSIDVSFNWWLIQTK
jgi:hypothetical protein